VEYQRAIDLDSKGFFRQQAEKAVEELKSVDKNTDEQDWTDYLIANPFHPANPLFYTSSTKTIFPGEIEKQALATS
jgi:hypothetical protein